MCWLLRQMPRRSISTPAARGQSNEEYRAGTVVIRKYFVRLRHPTINAGTPYFAAFARPFTAICDSPLPDSAECVFKATAINQFGCSKCTASLRGQGVYTSLGGVSTCNAVTCLTVTLEARGLGYCDTGVRPGLDVMKLSFVLPHCGNICQYTGLAFDCRW